MCVRVRVRKISVCGCMFSYVRVCFHMCEQREKESVFFVVVAAASTLLSFVLVRYDVGRHCRRCRCCRRRRRHCRRRRRRC